MSRAYDNAADARLQQGGRRNLIINGAMQVWQRGTSGSANGYSHADRWKTYYGTFSQESSIVPDSTDYSLKAVTDASNTPLLIQMIEPSNKYTSVDITVSFDVYSSATDAITKLELNDEGGSGGRPDGGAQTITAANTWERISYTFTTPFSALTGSAMAVVFTLKNSTTVYFANIQVEVGNVATPFEHRSYGEELALCQRYYYNSHEDGDFSDYNGQQVAIAVGTTTFGASCSTINGREYPSTMRATPTITLYHQDGTANAVYRIHDGAKVTGVSPLYITRRGFLYAYLSVGFAQGYGYYYGYTAEAEL